MSPLSAVRDALAAEGLAVEDEVPIGPLTTYRVGGAARVCATLERGDVAAFASVLRGHDVDILVVGNGSNLLVADGVVDVLAIRLGSSFENVEVDGDRLRAGAAARLPVVARRSVAAGLRGFEWAVGVPGTIGGAVRMNAGGHGSEIRECLSTVRVLDLRTGHDVEMAGEECEFGYRHSRFAAHHLVIEATLQLERSDDLAAGEALLSEIVQWRREHQPGGQNAGSVFTNPPGDSAGRLIDAAGCKGLRIGTAEVSTKHANFIQADQNGTAADVAAVMAAVVERVRTTHGVDLHPETVMVGFDDDTLTAVGVRR